MTDTKILERIRKLIAQAESTTFEHERRALWDKTQTLITRYQIDEAMLARTDGHAPTGIGDRTIVCEPPYAARKLILLYRIVRANGCDAIKLGTGRLHVIGQTTKLDIIEVLYTSLLVQLHSELQSTPVPPYETARGFRSSFVAGFAHEVGRRLEAARRRAERDAEVERGPGVGLVLASEADRIRARLDELYPKRSASRSMSYSSRGGLVAGRAAGATADIGGGRFGGGGGGRRALG